MKKLKQHPKERGKAGDEGNPYQDISTKGMGGSDIRGEDSVPDNPNKTSPPTDAITKKINLSR